MAPIRRYLRITQHSVLEVRIYLDNPAHAETWLLNPRDPALPRVIQAIRPLVLPKLREENENAKRKSGKKKRGVKDVLSEDDFEVSIFLTETSTQHALLTKRKVFKDKDRIKSNTGKLTGFFNNDENPIHVEDDEAPAILEEDDAGETRLADIPAVGAGGTRKIVDGGDQDAIFVNSDDEETQRQPRRKRKKAAGKDEEEQTTDDKKKLALNTAYEGFNIYGRILCLIVKRKGVKQPATTTAGGPLTGSQMLENWVSTQAAQDPLAGVDDDG